MTDFRRVRCLHAYSGGTVPDSNRVHYFPPIPVEISGTQMQLSIMSYNNTTNIVCQCFDIHELVTEEYLSEILLELKEDHKELLFLWAVRLFSSTRIAAIRQQSDRNIRKVRNTMMKKIRKELLSALTDKAVKQQPMTLVEKAFLADNGKAVDTEGQK